VGPLINITLFGFSAAKIIRMKTKFNGRAFKDTIVLAFLFIVFASCGTTNRSHSRKTDSAPQSDSQLADTDGNGYTIKLLPGNNLWMTRNLALNIPDSYCYENVESNCKQYGRLYTWEAAQKACNLLGEGWRLPTNADWQVLARQFGGVRDDSVDKGNAAYRALLQGGSPAFNALLGGGRDMTGNYARLDAHGFYWTATETGTGTAWFYNFGKGSGMLNRHNDGEKSRAFSVRCVKGIGRYN
jgi:uncharacterized protein (TIGR02145 family)